MYKNQYVKYFAADTETTVFPGQTFTEVWACGACELNTDECFLFNSIGKLFDFFRIQGCDCIIYFHNAAFDCEFIISYLLNEKKYKLAVDYIDEKHITTVKNGDMKNNTFKTSIGGNGEFYTMTVKTNNHILEFRDSFKLIPMSIKKMAKSFDTLHKKLEMEYVGKRRAGDPIKPEEEEYLKSDIFVLKEGLEKMIGEGHSRLTIGSCALAEFKKCLSLGSDDYKRLFPRMDEVKFELPGGEWIDADSYCRAGYRGAWCYVKKDIAGKMLDIPGKTCDCNSLYPSVMLGESGNYYPYGLPQSWVGNYIPDICGREDVYFFMTISTKFYIKPGHLPFIQKKNSFAYRPNECLETSDFYNYERDMYFDHYIDRDGNRVEAKIKMTITKTDWELIKEHYELVDCEILHGCYFYAIKYVFDDYINIYRKMKEEAIDKGLRTIAKLFLNNLYGKLATGLIPDVKIPYIDEDGAVCYHTVIGDQKKPVYIPAGAAVTSYARAKTIRAAQANYDNFCYADTDSLHCVNIDEFKGVEIHPSKFGAWKIETNWDRAIFVRQKTYIEHVIVEDDAPVTPHYLIKGCGFTDRGKELLEYSLLSDEERTGFKYQYKHTEAGLKFAEKHRKMGDYKPGLTVPDKLQKKHIPGGIILVDENFTIH